VTARYQDTLVTIVSVYWLQQTHNCGFNKYIIVG